MVRKANSELIDADQCVAQHNRQVITLSRRHRRWAGWIVVTYALQQRGIRPLVLEKHRIGYAWDQQRWDSCW